MIKNIISLLAILSFVFFAGCAGSNKNIKPNVSLENSYFKVLTLNNQKVEVFKKEAHIRFQKDGGVVGNLGCNNFFGEFAKNDENIEFTKVASTKMICPNIRIEDAFAKVLSGVKTFKIKGESMSFFDKNQKEIATFKAVYF